MFTMKTIKILFSLVVFVMMGLTVSAQAKKDTTVIFKVGIHCLLVRLNWIRICLSRKESRIIS